MRRGLPDQHLLDHPGLDSWYHPRDVRVMSSENLCFSIANYSTVTSSLNTRECLALPAASCDSVRRNHDITDRTSQTIYSLPSNTSLIWWEWCCQRGSEKIRPRSWQPNMRPPLTSKPDLNGGGIFLFPFYWFMIWLGFVFMS